MIRRLKNLPYERLRELWLFSLEKKRLLGDFIIDFQYSKRGYRKDQERLFIREYSDSTRVNGFKLKENEFYIVRTNFLLRHWKKLPRGAVDASSLKDFDARLDEYLDYLIYWNVSLPVKGELKQVSSDPNHSMTLILHSSIYVVLPQKYASTNIRRNENLILCAFCLAVRDHFISLLYIILSKHFFRNSGWNFCPPYPYKSIVAI